MIRTAERDIYETAWALPQYQAYAPGETYLPIFLDMAHPSLPATVLDAGCGSGKGAVALARHGFEVTCADLTGDGLIEEARGFPFLEQCLWDPIAIGSRYFFGRKVDWVYCCDVLEHIPPTFTMLVVSRLLEVARRGVFLSISTVPDQFGPWVGQAALHHSVQDFAIWRDQLAELGTVVEARDLLQAGAYLVTPRC